MHMGKTAFSGPVYGAKQTLMAANFNASSGASTIVYAGTIVPSGEDWFATEVSFYKGDTGSTGLVAVVRDDSTTVSSQAISSSLAGTSTIVIVTKDAGEYEGAKIASGSTVTFEVLSPTVGTSRVTITLSGFRRFLSSTRAE
jgi:hypothetical protein